MITVTDDTGSPTGAGVVNVVAGGAAATDKAVWQYGHDGVAGSTTGYLNNPGGVDLLPPYSLTGTYPATMGGP